MYKQWNSSKHEKKGGINNVEENVRMPWNNCWKRSADEQHSE